jgi:hypothetical protein
VEEWTGLGPCGAPRGTRTPNRQIRSPALIARPCSCDASVLLTSQKSGAFRPSDVPWSACWSVVFRQELRQRRPSRGSSTRFLVWCSPRVPVRPARIRTDPCRHGHPTSSASYSPPPGLLSQAKTRELLVHLGDPRRHKDDRVNDGRKLTPCRRVILAPLGPDHPEDRGRERRHRRATAMMERRSVHRGCTRMVRFVS